MRTFTARILCAFAIAALLVVAFLVSAPPARTAQTLPHGAHSYDSTIDKYIVDISCATSPNGQPSSYLYRASDYITLKGPITVLIYIWDDGNESETPVTIEEGKTYTFACAAHSPPGDLKEWYATVTLLEVQTTPPDPTSDQMNQLIIGTGPAELLSFIKKYSSPENQTTAFTAADEAYQTMHAAVSAALTGKLQAHAASANIAKALAPWKTMAFLGDLKDAKTGKPLFPSLAHPGVQAVISKMAVKGLVDQQAFNAATKLVNLLAGMDIANLDAPSSGP